MTELKNGIIDINGLIISKETKLADFQNHPMVSKIHQTEKAAHINISEPICVNGINAYIKVRLPISKQLPYVIEITPKLPPELKTNDTEQLARNLLQISKQWLKGMIDEPPTTEGTQSILYSYSWGIIDARLYMTRDYGLTGGIINIEYRDNY